MRYRAINQPGTVDAMRVPEISTAEFRNFVSAGRQTGATWKRGQWLVRDQFANLRAFDDKWFHQLFERPA